MVECNTDTILELCEIKYTDAEDINDFYFKFRSLVSSHLKKKGDLINLPSCYQLLEDEILSPTFEEVIILWCLEKIDPDLPRQVKQTFGSQLKENECSLLDIHQQIFKVIPVLLDFDTKEGMLDNDICFDVGYIVNRENESAATKACLKDDSLKEEELENVENDDINQDKNEDQYLKYETKVKLEPRNDASVRKEIKKKIKGNDGIENSGKAECTICNKVFKSEKHLGWHQRYHKEDSKTYSCTVCNKEFKTKMRFYAHKQTHKIEHCDCDVCGKSFDTRKAYTDHIYKHHRTDIQCRKCDKVLHNFVEHRNHMKQHDNHELVEDNANKIEVADQSIINNVENDIQVYKITSVLRSNNEDINGVDAEIQETTIIEINPIKEESFRGFFCKICCKTYDSKIRLEAHQELHKIDQEFCEFCEQIFESKEVLLDHITANHSKDISCKNCDMVLNNVLDFKVHMKSVHKGINSNTACSCEICGKVLKSLDSLKSHLKKHTRILTCTICDMKFDSKSLFNAHMKNVHDVVSLDQRTPCELCGKLVTQPRLKKHMKTHLSKFKCATCSRAFTSEEELGSHVCKHYSCDICDKRFVQGRNLDLHKREHAGETMYHCDLCEALFDKKKLLGSHRRFLHFRSKSFKCELCNKEFAVKMGLANHMRLHTGERPYNCNECGQNFRTNSSLHTHKKMHSNDLQHECDGCHKRFRMAGNLKSHREAKLCGLTEGDLFRNNVEK